MPITRKLRIAAFAVVAATAALGATTAQASAAAGSPKPAKVVSTTFQSVRDGLADGVVAPDATIQDTCRTFTYGVNTTSAAGVWLSTFIQDVSWCYNGTTITFHNYSYRQSTQVGSQYGGLISQAHQASSGNTFWQDNASAVFRTCLPAIGCWQEWHPWISTVVRANGTASGSGGTN